MRLDSVILLFLPTLNIYMLHYLLFTMQKKVNTSCIILWIILTTVYFESKALTFTILIKTYIYIYIETTFLSAL